MPRPTARGKRPVGSPVREPLSYALGSRSKVACLRTLATAQEQLSQREVARRAGVQHRSAQAALDELVALGLVQRVRGGRDALVKISGQHYLSAILTELFIAESAFFLSLRSEITRLVTDAPRDQRATSAGLFGSVARGDDRPDSDLDVLLLTERESAIEPLLNRFGGGWEQIRDRFGCNLRPIAYTVTEARRRWRRREAPLPEAVGDHIPLVGPALRDLLDG